ncbi:hypothetical protein, partial [Halalkalibacterium halodurans]|uniref:hypothetical protein n=1 Tax=Halalkalibacterium halodurans TaxID=86665 RepID=UPI001ABA1AFC
SGIGCVVTSIIYRNQGVAIFLLIKPSNIGFNSLFLYKVLTIRQIVARGMNDQVDALKWIHSHSVHFQLNINGERVFTGADLPHHEKIEIVIHEEVNEHDRKTNN